MVEVDLRMFVSCRLCLDVQGNFQIDPTVQHQMKYCFDIDVEPFDGLPQLICKKCENTLREHYEVKKNFQKKQEQLKAKLRASRRRKSRNSLWSHQDCLENFEKSISNSISSRFDDSENSNSCVDHNEITTRKKKKVKKKRIIRRLISSSSDVSEDSDSPGSLLNANAQKEAISWDANLNKDFVCRICSHRFQNKEDITKHIKEHSTLQKKYKNVFKRSCSVVMEKSDNKPNLCSNNKTVVYSSDFIIESKNNPFYYINYHPKIYNNIPISCRSESKKKDSSEYLDGAILIRKRKRSLSRSSSETVVINQRNANDDTSEHAVNNNNPPIVIDCIDIGDSSDESCDSNKGRSFVNKGKWDSKPMYDLIKMCHKRYTKHLHLEKLENKISQIDKGKEELLKHKVLSIGRKIINNKGFNCTGILRYVEYKNLYVIWKEISLLNCTNDRIRYVRIAIKLKGHRSNHSNNAAWSFFDSLNYHPKAGYTVVDLLKKMKPMQTFQKVSKMNSVRSDEEYSIKPEVNSVISHTDFEITKVDPDNMLVQKLLNKNPVSNPKQLPKKLNTTESYSKNWKVTSSPNTLPPIMSGQADINDETVTSVLPIVTSTISLAHMAGTELTVSAEDSSNTSNQSKFPRIKVKPVSELMPHNTTNHNSNDTCAEGLNPPYLSRAWNDENIALNKQQQWPGQATLVPNVSTSQMWDTRNHTYKEKSTYPQTVNVPNIPLNEHNEAPRTNIQQPSTDNETVLLDTVEFPNKKTSSPYQYLKDLLLVHNIALLDADQPLPAGAVCLIRLKILYEQEKCQPITLCLSLFCFKNCFCMQIRDSNYRIVNLNSFTANWQWQLLQIYNNDVINKVLLIAANTCPETYQYTKNFFTLLRSIKSI